MSGLVKFFENAELGKVRVIQKDDQLWFVGKDVLDALEYAEGYNPSRAFDVVPADWKGVQPMHTPGGEQEMLCITEQGLYFFLGRSDKPKALPYQRWIAGEVVPAIIHKGKYVVQEKQIVMPDFDDPVAAARAWADEREKRNRLENKVQAIAAECSYHQDIERIALKAADEHKKARGQIASSREAKALSEKGQIVKENKRLKDALGISDDWMRVSAIPWLTEVFTDSNAMRSAVGEKLSRLSKEHGYPIKYLGIPPTSKIRVYHKAIVDRLYIQLIFDRNMLARFRHKA